MTDPRNIAHDKKVNQEKKHQGAGVGVDEMSAAQSGKKSAAVKKKRGSAGVVVESADGVSSESVPSDASTVQPSVSLEGSLTVLAKLKEMEFYSRANLQHLASLSFTIEDELKQKDIVGPLGEVLSAQNAFQTSITGLLEVYKTECDRLQGAHE